MKELPQKSDEQKRLENLHICAMYSWPPDYKKAKEISRELKILLRNEKK